MWEKGEKKGKMQMVRINLQTGLSQSATTPLSNLTRARFLLEHRKEKKKK